MKQVIINFLNFISIHNLGINAGRDENDKVCKELENVKLEVKNVRVEMRNFKDEMRDLKYEVMRKLEALIEKTPDPYSCIGCTMGSFCLNGKPVGGIPLERAMVRADSNITICNGVVYAGDTGIAYIRADCRFAVIWKEAGVQVHNYDDDKNIVYNCVANWPFRTR